MAITTTSPPLSLSSSDELFSAFWTKVNGNNAAGSESNMQLLKAFCDAVVSDLVDIDTLKASVINKTATISTSWSGSAAPFAQTIAIEGILTTDTPIVDLVPSSTFATAEQEEQEWAKVYKITTADGSITVYAKEATTLSLNIKLQIVR